MWELQLWAVLGR